MWNRSARRAIPHIHRRLYQTERITIRNATGWEMLRRVLPFVWPKGGAEGRAAKARIVLAFGLLLGGKVLNVQVPYIFRDLIDGLNATIGGTGVEALNVFSVSGTVLLAYTGARLGASLFGELRNAVFARVAQASQRRVALATFEHLHALGHSFHVTKANAGVLSRTIDRGLKGINFMFIATVFNIAPTVVEIGLVCGLLGHQFGLAYAGLAGGTMLAYTVFTLRVTSWRTKFRKEMNAAENLASHLAFDSLSHQETVKQFRGEAHEARRYEGALRAYETASRETAASLALLNVGQQAIVTAALGGVMWMTISNILGGSGSIGDLVLVNGLILQLSLPLNFLGSVYRELRQAIVDVEGLLSLRAVEPEINSPDKPVRRVDGSTEIRFEQVGFHYPEDPNRSVLNGLSFTVPAGATVGIVGPSGCGKSTVARLLTRIVEPSAGQIRLGGVPIGQLALGELRAAFGVVPQDTALFNESLAYNIAYGRPDATMEEIRRAAVLAQIDELAMRLPQGYETRVGERGVVLSGGERQRVALARALLLDPPILILDEATSALDSRTEQQVIRSLCESSKRRTVIMIAHRLSTVADADLILVIGPNGCLAEFGTHQSLVAKEGGSYRELWMAQQRDKENSGDDVD